MMPNYLWINRVKFSNIKSVFFEKKRICTTYTAWLQFSPPLSYRCSIIWVQWLDWYVHLIFPEYRACVTLIWIILDHSSDGKNEARKARIWSTKMAATRLPVNRNHGNIYWPNRWSTLELEYQDGASGFKILLAEYIVCVIQYYSDQWCVICAICRMGDQREQMGGFHAGHFRVSCFVPITYFDRYVHHQQSYFYKGRKNRNRVCSYIDYCDHNSFQNFLHTRSCLEWQHLTE